MPFKNPVSGEDMLCRYTGGPGTGWECTQDSFTATTINQNNVQALSDWTVGCTQAEFSTPPTIAVDSGDVMLSWDAVDGATEYNIYRANTPYFTPGSPSYASTTDTTWTDPDPNALGDSAINYYYIVR
ncbi:MAG: hypothetical protein GY759_19105, partial [Chloroflexi bacterium]|nr:hypothetical protein [Chloroflexota bacterium]